MNKEDIRLATKAQASAVRAYLESIGVAISHTQALEVIARGEGMRSRHLLASRPALATEPAPAQGAQGHFTRVGYTYSDGSNCKRSSAIVFRGRLTPEQLRFIRSRLDEGRFFVPCQVGFESLHFAFTDDGGDDHYWHEMELGDPDDWELDAHGYVLEAGDVRQVPAAAAAEFATDADCENLVWRFGRVLRWNEVMQKSAITSGAYQRDAERRDESPERVVDAWRQRHRLVDVPQQLLMRLAERLVDEGFYLVSRGELQRPVGPNAYQFVLVEQPDAIDRDAVLVSFDVTTPSGSFLTHSPAKGVHPDKAERQMDALCQALAEQLRIARTLPAAFDRLFE